MKIQKFQKGKVVLNAFDALGDLMKKGDLKVKRPRVTTTIKKQPTIVHERVEYTPPTRLTAEDKRIYNAWQKYKGTGVYATMPEEQAYKLFLDDWNFRHDPSRQLMKSVQSQINYQDKLSGVTTPDWMRKTILGVVDQFPSAVRTDIPGILKGNITPRMLPYHGQVYQMPSFGMPGIMNTSDDVFRTIIAPRNGAIYKSNPDVLKISDYLSGRSYRGIGDLDRPFINATDAFNAGAPDAAFQFLKAGLNDAAGIIGVPGFKPVSFPYKPKSLKVK